MDGSGGHIPSALRAPNAKQLLVKGQADKGALGVLQGGWTPGGLKMVEDGRGWSSMVKDDGGSIWFMIFGDS